MKYLKLFEEYSSNPIIVKSGEIDTPGGITICIVDHYNKTLGNVNVEAYDSGRNTDSDLEKFHQTTENLPFNNSNSAYIHTLSVDPEYRRMGHGKTLVKLAEEESSRLGRPNVTAIVSKDNINSQGLFKKLGYYRLVDTDKKDLLHKNIEDGSVLEGFSDHMASQGHTLASFYKKELQDFTLEQEILQSLSDIEELGNEVFDPRGRWSWNRERRDFKDGHFTLNVKVYNWPTVDDVKAAFPDQEDIDDEWLEGSWIRFIEDQREMWQEDIEETYSWVEDTGFGGRSGGWLVIKPRVSYDNYLEFTEEAVQEYLDLKEFIDDDEMEEIKSQLNSAEWQRLRSLGLSQESGEVGEIISGAEKAIGTIKQYTREIEKMDSALERIKEQFEKFEVKAKEYYMDWLEGEMEINEGKRPKGSPKWRDSNAPDAKGRFKSLGIGALADWLIRTRGGNMQRITGSLNQQIVFNRGKNPSYAKKMERVREAVKRKLAKRKKK